MIKPDSQSRQTIATPYDLKSLDPNIYNLSCPYIKQVYTIAIVDIDGIGTKAVPYSIVKPVNPTLHTLYRLYANETVLSIHNNARHRQLKTGHYSPLGQVTHLEQIPRANYQLDERLNKSFEYSFTRLFNKNERGNEHDLKKA